MAFFERRHDTQRIDEIAERPMFYHEYLAFTHNNTPHIISFFALLRNSGPKIGFWLLLWESKVFIFSYLIRAVKKYIISAP